MSANSGMQDSVEKAAMALLEYCKREKWVGYDPYDGLNILVFGALPLSKIRTFRLIITQAMKRLPVNLRPVLLIPKGESPKACALFCCSLIRLSDIGILKDDSVVSVRLERLIKLRSKGYQHYCWGYDFDWQGRGFFLPKFHPNIICTTFAGNALLDAFEKYGEQKFLDAASSAGEFLINELNLTYENGGLCFSYTPWDQAQVHNANLLGAAFLGRVSGLTGRKKFRDIAERAVRFSLLGFITLFRYICSRHTNRWALKKAVFLCQRNWLKNFFLFPCFRNLQGSRSLLLLIP